MSDDPEFRALRQEPDPIRQAILALELQTRYQQRVTELSRLRRAAIARARAEMGLLDIDIASRLKISKGRLSQLKKSGPLIERIFFGVGPVSIGVPYRYQTTDRTRPLIAAEDAQTAEQLTKVLEALMFSVTRYQVEPDQVDLPDGDTIVVCGPKSAPLAADLLARDPALSMLHEGERWWIQETETGDRHGSPSDDTDGTSQDVAYLARHVLDDRVVLHIAGIHSIGSHGAVHYLEHHLGKLFGDVAEQQCSMVVRCTFDGLQIIDSDLVAGPFTW